MPIGRDHPGRSRICPQCELRFDAKCAVQKYCSQVCGARSRGKYCAPDSPVYVDITCAGCSASFKTPLQYFLGRARSGQTPPTYCSRRCWGASRTATFRAARPDSKACSICRTVKPYTAEFFGIHKKSWHGLSGRCRVCASSYAKDINLRSRNKLRIAVLTAYGDGRMACTCCGESHPEFLTLDHINGGGAKERKTLPSAQLYTKLRRLGFPKGEHRTLCFNCNWAMGHYGYCPHQKTAESQPVK